MFPTLARHLHVPRAILVLLLIGVLSACEGSTEPVPVPDEVELSLVSATFEAIDDTVTIQVEVRDQFGDPIENPEVNFESQDPTVASASAAGLIRATGPGSTSIEVAAGEATEWVAVTVEQTPTEAAFTSTPPADAPAGSEIEGIGVRVLDANGHPVAGVAVEFEAHQGALQGEVIRMRATESDGVADFTWTIPLVAGQTARLEIRPEGLAGLQVELAVVAADPAELVLVSGAAQSALRGESLTEPMRVRLSDAFGNPVPDRSVSVEVVSGGGAAQADAPVTDAQGEVGISWTLGPELGSQQTRVEIAGLELQLDAMAVAEPDQLVLVSGGGQQAHRTLELPEPVVVRVLDEAGQPIPGVSVDAELPGEDGSVSPTRRTTGTSGEASFEWTLGTAIGAVTLEVTVDELRLDVPAQALAVPDSLEQVAGDAQTGPAGQALPDHLRVRVLDQVGLPLPGVGVGWSITSGGGTVQGSSVGTTPTNGQGIASASWVLGTDGEEQALEASVNGVGSVAFTATADLSAPASFQVMGGSGQSAEVGETLPGAVTVELLDLAGDPVGGATVTWSPSGDGSVGPADTQTDALGRAQATWTLGSSGGGQSLAIEAAGLDATATALATQPPGSSGFMIEYDWQSSIDPDVQDAFEAAADRWSQVITGDLADVQLDVSANAWCTDEAISQVVDDVLIVVIIESIDGVGGTLGSAGPCYLRTGSDLPLLGRVRLDEADVQNMLSNGTLGDVILHEIGHVLGIGTLWNSFGLLQDPAAEADPDLDPWFSGAGAIAGFDAVGGTSYTDGNKVPVENTGGGGTRNAHWRESALEHELMTGWLSALVNPLSLVTVGSLADLGYQVDSGQADSYGYAPMVLGGDPLLRIHLGDDIERGPIRWVEPDGTVREGPLPRQPRRHE